MGIKSLVNYIIHSNMLSNLQLRAKKKYLNQKICFQEIKNIKFTESRQKPQIRSKSSKVVIMRHFKKFDIQDPSF